ncbi:MAG: PAS domain-containing protein [Synechococcaceae cyanobacterium SM2_3_1]|nr:PAS domain-containing protein [Synechococcaceae cyanobacterium SM2_3_1]
MIAVSHDLKSVFDPEARWVDPQTHLLEAAQLLQSQVEGSYLLVGNEPQVAGILTEKKIIALLLESGNPRETRIIEVLNEPLVRLNLRDYENLEATLRLMLQQQLRYLPVVDDEGDLVGVVQQVRLQDYLRDHDPQVAPQILPHLSDAVVAVDIEQVVTYWNSQAEALYGIPAQGALGQTLPSLINYRFLELDDEEQAWKSLHTQGSWRGEVLHHRRDGTPLMVEATVNMIKEEHGSPTGMLAVLRDATQRKEGELVNQSIVQAIPDMMIRMRADGTYLNFYGSGSVLDVTPEVPKHAGVHIQDCLPRSLVEKRLAACEQALRTNTLQTYEQEIFILGNLRYEEVRVIPCGEDAVLMLIRDITDRKHAEAERAAAIATVNTILESITDCFLALDFDWHFTYVNQQFEQVTGQKRQDLLGHSLWEIFPAMVGTVLEQSLHRVMTERQGMNCEAFYPPFQMWLHMYAYPSATGIAVYFQDMTQRKQAEQELQFLNAKLQYQVEVRNAELEQMIRYERLLQLITDEVRSSLEEQTILQTTVQEVAEGLHLTYCNVSLLESVPLPDPPPDPLYYTIAYEHTRFPLSFQGTTASIHSDALPQMIQGETIYFSTDHSLWGLSVNVVCPIRDDRGLMGFLRLIRLPEEEFTLAEIRLAEQVASQCAVAIRQAKLYAATQQKVHQLTELNQLKDEFLHTVSHELRTPLTNMKMALTMLEIHQDPDRQQRYMQMLKAEWQRELNLVNELLELQALESGSRALAITAISLSTWLPPLTHSLLMRFQERQIRFACQLPEDLGLLHTDVALLERILLELLNNACKYTPAQEQVILSVTPVTGGYQFQVINTGVVIPAEQLSLIFEKFHRIPAMDCYNQGGTGLGLALVKRRWKS